MTLIIKKDKPHLDLNKDPTQIFIVVGFILLILIIGIAFLFTFSTTSNKIKQEQTTEKYKTDIVEENDDEDSFYWRQMKQGDPLGLFL